MFGQHGNPAIIVAGVAVPPGQVHADAEEGRAVVVTETGPGKVADADKAPRCAFLHRKGCRPGDGDGAAGKVQREGVLPHPGPRRCEADAEFARLPQGNGYARGAGGTEIGNVPKARDAVLFAARTREDGFHPHVVGVVGVCELGVDGGPQLEEAVGCDLGSQDFHGAETGRSQGGGSEEDDGKKGDGQ